MDVHDGSATVKEAIEFSALLRQAPEIPEIEKLNYVKVMSITLANLLYSPDSLLGSLLWNSWSWTVSAMP